MRVIAGKVGGLRLDGLRGDATRPTSDRVKESLFAILTPYLSGAMVLDLFAGSGGLGIEALSRGAKRALFVERSREAVLVIRKNLERTGLADLAEVWKSDVNVALRRLASGDAHFDLIFADPPYGQGMAQRALDAVAEGRLLCPDGRLVIEHSSKEEIPEVAQNLELSRRVSYGDTVVSIYIPVGAI